MRTACRLALLCALGVGAACSDGSEPSPSPAAAKHSVSLSFTQLLPNEGTGKALLRVANEGEEPLVVTGAGLRWSGYGEFVDHQDSTIAPGRTLDLRVLLPPARCDEGRGPVVGVVQTPTSVVAQPLTPSGQQFVRHLWLRGCQTDLVHQEVSISYARDWHLGERGGEPAAEGSLLLERNAGAEPLAVVSGRGSVLYDLVLAERVVARPSEPETLVPLAIMPGNRCDEHARGQATAPFTFRVTVVVDGTRVPVLVLPPTRVQALATEALDRACAQRASTG